MKERVTLPDAAPDAQDSQRNAHLEQLSVEQVAAFVGSVFFVRCCLALAVRPVQLEDFRLVGMGAAFFDDRGFCLARRG